jgi:hypothetical protein
MKRNKFIFLIIAIVLCQLLSGQVSYKIPDTAVTITGKVVNSDSKPVAGAILYIDNIKTNVTTKRNGSYKIKVNPSSTSLVVHSAEFGKSEAVINGKSEINFILDGKSEKISETVTSDLTKREKHRVQKERNLIRYHDIYDMIRCEVSGAVVTGKSIRLHQGHSFLGSDTPLFLVNGVIVPSIDNIAPLDVKSIDALTGSSASIYGVNGSNGVITITLKNGSETEK